MPGMSHVMKTAAALLLALLLLVVVMAADVSATDSVEVMAHTCGVVENGTARPVRVVVTVSESYFPVFVNWLLYFGRICPGLSSLYIMCLDPKAEKLVPTIGLTCSAVHHSSIESSIWLARTQLAQGLLQRGYDVVLSDSDAYWIRNPFHEIGKHPTSDIVSSRGTFPERVSRELGASLCMGFIYIRSSNHTARLWTDVIQEMSKTQRPDDQRDVNVLLLRLGLQYPEPKPSPQGYPPNTGNFTHNEYEYTVTLLSHFTFRRYCNLKKPHDLRKLVFVAHCFVREKVGQSKLAAAETLGLWQLKGNWSETPLTGDLDGFLASLVRTNLTHKQGHQGPALLGAPVERRTSMATRRVDSSALQLRRAAFVWLDFNQDRSAFLHMG